ncbi:MAG: cache domain-containing protein [Spirochaetales bacterium]|nr:cache domain-containing protein [Spirochaetales bacterium]
MRKHVFVIQVFLLSLLFVGVLLQDDWFDHTEWSLHELNHHADVIQLSIQSRLQAGTQGAHYLSQDPIVQDWGQETQPVEHLYTLLESMQETLPHSLFEFASDRLQLVYQAGRTIVQMTPENPRDTWFYDFKNSSAKQNITLFYDSTEGVLYLYNNVKVFADDGSFSGIIGIRIPYESFAETLEQEMHHSGMAYIVDEQGTILVHPEQEKIGSAVIYDFYGMLQAPQQESLRPHQLQLKNQHHRITRSIGIPGIYLVVEGDTTWINSISLSLWQPMLLMLIALIIAGYIIVFLRPKWLLRLFAPVERKD